MKPKEFDELVRQKFDQNDFAYSPGNWDKLAEQLDGRAKKRSMIMWLWMPALGMAASVALAIGVTGMLRFGAPANDVNGSYTQTSQFIKQQPAHEAVAMIVNPLVQPVAPVVKAAPVSGRPAVVNKVAVAQFGISMNNILNQKAVKNIVTSPVNLAAVPNNALPQPANAAPKNKKPEQPITPGYNTFASRSLAAVKKPLNFSVIHNEVSIRGVAIAAM